LFLIANFLAFAIGGLGVKEAYDEEFRATVFWIVVTIAFIMIGVAL
jgi:hypothetical protein